MPVQPAGVPADVPIAQLPKPRDQHPALGPAPEWHAKPRPGIDTDETDDRPLGGLNIGPEPTPIEERHAGVVEGMAADQVAIARQLAGEARVGLGPSPLDEERGTDIEPTQARDQGGRALAAAGPIRVLSVERQRDAEARRYFSTPLMTMPRVKKRWNTMKMRTGITSVIRVPA